MTKAYARSNPGSVEIHNNTAISILDLTIPEAKAGRWVIFGRVGIYNYSGDRNEATARITTDDGSGGRTVLDHIELQVLGGDSVCASLQAILVLPSQGETNNIDIRCGTWNGKAFQARLIAIEVDEIL
jgi:hypothetical protein